MEINVHQVRTTRNNQDLSYSTGEVDILEAIQVLIDVSKAAEAGPTRFGIKPLTMTITF